jgi:hypothetical protein
MDEITSTPTQLRSAEVDKIVAAIVKVQGAATSVPKSKTAKAGSYSYDYADLTSIVDAFRAPLAANGLAVVHQLDAELVLRTTLFHTSGQWLASVVPLHDASPQSLGSEISYMRRYSLGGLLGIVTDDDDDARTAEGKRPPKPRKPAATPPASKPQPQAKPEEPPPPAEQDRLPPPLELVRKKASKALWAQAKQTAKVMGWDDEELLSRMKDRMAEEFHGITSSTELSAQQLGQLRGWFVRIENDSGPPSEGASFFN